MKKISLFCFIIFSRDVAGYVVTVGTQIHSVATQGTPFPFVKTRQHLIAQRVGLLTFLPLFILMSRNLIPILNNYGRFYHYGLAALGFIGSSAAESFEDSVCDYNDILQFLKITSKLYRQNEVNWQVLSYEAASCCLYYSEKKLFDGCLFHKFHSLRNEKRDIAILSEIITEPSVELVLGNNETLHIVTSTKETGFIIQPIINLTSSNFMLKNENLYLIKHDQEQIKLTWISVDQHNRLMLWSQN